ncbi:uncharacterized protein YggE [Methylobacterium sp. BE186]|uniref:SIMPL domain-containing protein n=1 Tax=Methylobacterium sp. BE186 TaxID=2817715 RepID=UPI002863892B|nr:SIMPL domain-containing protein [Methylobacterium sp. BE186]MDR7040680.1 uncharacterized protein YggE [Methylobacterium sp. BE186]
MLKIALVTLGILAGTLSQAQAQEDQPRSRLPSMTVTASATREVVPDIAVLRLSISTERPTASAATEETARTSQTVLAEIRAQGLDPRDLKTAITVSPMYDEERGPQGQTLKRALRGYVARNALTVRLRDIARAGALTRSLIEKGANVLEGIQFEISEDQRRTDELRVQAIKEAARKAKLYAEAAQVRLGRVLAVEPDPDAQALPLRAAPAVSGGVTAIIPVEPGVEQVTARVSVTWEITP